MQQKENELNKTSEEQSQKTPQNLSEELWTITLPLVELALRNAGIVPNKSDKQESIINKQIRSKEHE